MSNVTYLLEQRRLKSNKEGFTHVWNSHLALSLAVSQNSSVKPATQYATTSLNIDKTGDYLLGGDSYGGVSVYDVRKKIENGKNEFRSISSVPGRSHSSAHQYSVESVKWYPHDSGMFLSGSSDKKVKVWDTNEMAVCENFTFSGHVYEIDLCKKSGKNSTVVATALSNHQISLCDLNTGSSVHTLRGHTAAVNCVQWSNRNQYGLYSAGRDGRLVMWDTRRSKAAVHHFDKLNGSAQSAHSGAVTSLTQTEDGLYVITTGNDEQARLWDVSAGTNTLINFGKAALADVKHFSAAISYRACYPGLLYLPCGSSISVYDIMSGEEIQHYNGHYGRVNCTEYNPVRPQLFSGSADCTVLVWEPPSPGEEEGEEEEVKVNPYTDNWSDED